MDTLARETKAAERPNPLRLGVMAVLPVVVLLGVIALFLATNGAGLQVEPAAPIETLDFERTVLEPGRILLYVRNTSPQAITLAQINIDDGFVPFAMEPGQSLSRLAAGVISIPYPWVTGEAYEITVFSSNSVPFTTPIEVAARTVKPSSSTLLSYTLIGVYVGVIPVVLGMFWFPVLRRLGPRWMMFLMALTAGLLIFLGIDTLVEALEIAAELGGPFQGVGLVGIGSVVTFLLLAAISRRQTGLGRGEAHQRLSVAYMIALGIGLHNLGEGLAIGAAYSTGAAALGAFLVVGFILQNLTEGLAIIAPILKDRPRLSTLVLLGVIGGVPAVVGAWIGGLVNSQPLAVLCLAIGAGAIFEVVYEIARLIQKDSIKRPMPMTIFSGVTAGMLMLYVTGLLIK
jgi:zinc transporter ZupT